MNTDKTSIGNENQPSCLGAVISWVAVSERLPLADGNKQLFVWDGYQYEIARFNEWGFHYGTRNTQDCLFSVVFWAECPEPPCL